MQRISNEALTDDGSIAQRKCEQLVADAQMVVDQIQAARAEWVCQLGSGIDPPQAKKRKEMKTKSGVDYLGVLNNMGKPELLEEIDLPEALKEPKPSPHQHRRRGGGKPKELFTAVYWNGNQWTDKANKYMKKLAADMFVWRSAFRAREGTSGGKRVGD